MSDVNLTDEQLLRLRIALIVGCYQEAVEAEDETVQAAFRRLHPSLCERFDRVHVELEEIKRAREAREQQ